jgi:hypothetical protein
MCHILKCMFINLSTLFNLLKYSTIYGIMILCRRWCIPSIYSFTHNILLIPYNVLNDFDNLISFYQLFAKSHGNEPLEYFIVIEFEHSRRKFVILSYIRFLLSLNPENAFVWLDFSSNHLISIVGDRTCLL